jgi:hypothetical protein
MKLRPRIPGRLATAAALAVGSALLVAAPAAADPQTILYACRTTSVFGPVDTTLDAEVEAVAPATVAAGGDQRERLPPRLPGAGELDARLRLPVRR